MTTQKEKQGKKKLINKKAFVKNAKIVKKSFDEEMRYLENQLKFRELNRNR